jgi:DNA end-binding protein Ku
MRSMWKGSVSFGLVSIPVKLYAATEQHDVSFRQVRRSDGSRVRYKRVAEADGEEVAFADIAKGYELPTGEIIVLTDEDFADLPLPTKRTVDVLEFVPLADIDPIYFNKSYYLEPEKQGFKPYALLRDALVSSGMVAVVKVAISNREQLATLRVKDDVMILATMMWPDEIRKPDFDFLNQDVAVRPQELAMADALISSMASEFDATQFTDEFQAALAEVLDAKALGDKITPAPSAALSSGRVVDLLAALQASIDQAQTTETPSQAADRKRTLAAAPEAPTKAAAKKAPAKKTPAKRASRKSA